MNKKYVVKLTAEERAKLESIINTGRHQARVIKRANALLLADDEETHAAIAEICGISQVTMSHIARRYCEGGLSKALYEVSRPGAKTKFTREEEARIAALAASKAPDGRSGWTLRLLAAKAVELQLCESVAPATIAKILKKARTANRGKNASKSGAK